jgi:serine/threonine protein kinase
MPFYEEDLEFVAEELPLTLPQIQMIAFQLLQAVMYLHRQDIVHRSIQPSSVMLSASGSSESIARKYSVRLGGLSDARSLRPPFPKHLSDLRNAIEDSSLSLLDPSQPWFEDLMTPDASMRYWAPEIILKEYLHMVFPSFDWRKADMWSAGVTIAEMLRQGRRMFLSTDARGLLDEMVSFADCRPVDATILDRFPFLYVPVADSGRDLENWLMAPRGTNERKIREVGMFGPVNHNKMKERAVDLVRRLLQVDPKKRVSIEEALAHPFFEEIRPNMIQFAGLKPATDLVTDDKLQLFVHGRCGGI